MHSLKAEGAIWLRNTSTTISSSPIKQQDFGPLSSTLSKNLINSGRTDMNKSIQFRKKKYTLKTEDELTRKATKKFQNVFKTAEIFSFSGNYSEHPFTLRFVRFVDVKCEKNQLETEGGFLSPLVGQVTPHSAESKKSVGH